MAAEPLVIEGEHRCVNDVMTVHDDVVVKAGGRLVLEDCILEFDAPDYTDTWVSTGLEGLLLHVEEGASLEVRAVDGDAGFRAVDRKYGYSLLVDGDFVMEGTAANPVTVTGLEGYITEGTFNGGIKVVGTATLNHVNYTVNQGPSLYVLSGSTEANDLLVRKNSGAFAVSGGHLALRNVDANVGVVGIYAIRSTLVMDNVTMHASRFAVDGSRSDITVVDSDVASLHVAVDLQDTNLTLRDSWVRYGAGGITHAHKDSYVDRAVVRVEGTLIEGITGQPESQALSIDHADLVVHDSVLRNYTWFGINHRGGSASLIDNQFDGTGQYHAYLARPRAYETAGNTLADGTENGIVYAAGVTIEVRDGGGAVENATVVLADAFESSTNPEGLVSMVVTVPLLEDGLYEETLSVEVSDGNRTRTLRVPLSETHVIVDMDAKDAGKKAPGLPVVALLVAVGAAAVVVRRR